ncbi:hypothetical protein [Solicola sp. PLA-1-18]
MSGPDPDAPRGPDEEEDTSFSVHEPAESADESSREVNENQGDDAASGG